MATFEEQIQQRVLALASSGASDAEIDAFIADAMSAKSSFGPKPVEPVSTITGMTPSEAQARGEAGMEALQAGVAETAAATPPAIMRYGGPVAAGIATGGMSYFPQAASMVGAFGLSEAGAQTLENIFTGEEFRPKQIGVSAMYGVAQPLSIAQTNRAFGLVADNIRAGQGVVNFLANVGLQTAASETARAVDDQRGFFDAILEKPATLTDIALRFGVPTATSLVGTRLSYNTARAEQAASRAEQLTKERFGRRFVLGELLEGYSDMDRRAYADKIPVVVDALDNLGTDISTTVVNAFKGLPGSDDVANGLLKTGAIGRIEQLQAAANAAKRAQEQADAAYLQAGREASADLPKFEENARKAGIEAGRRYALYQVGLRDEFGVKPGDIFIGSATRKQQVEDLAAAAEGSVKTGISSLYDAAGIGINDPVVNMELLVDSISRRIGDKNARVEIMQAIDAKAKSLPTLINADGTLSRSSFLRIRDDIASQLTQAGNTPNYANKVAGQAYQAIVEASEAFMQARDPAKLQSLKTANAANRSIVEAVTGLEPELRESVIPMLKTGRINDVVRLIESPSAIKVADEIEAYASALRGIGDPASKAAADRFKEQTYKAIRDELVENSALSVGGIDDLFRRVDAGQLAKRVDALRANKFPVERLGLGKSDGIKALAKLSNEYGLSVEDANRFLNDLQDIGPRAAEAHFHYEKAARDYLTSGTPAEQKRHLNRMQLEARKAKMDYQTSERLLARARLDPLAELFTSTSLNLNPDTSKNGKYVLALLDAGPYNVRRLMNSLEGPALAQAGIPPAEVARRSRLADTIRKSTAREVFLNSVESSIGPDDKSVAFQQVTNFFYGDSAAASRQRESFVALLGKKTFEELKDKYAKPINSVLQTAKNYGSRIYQFSPETTVAASAVSMVGAAGAPGASGLPGAQRGKILKGWFDDIRATIRNGRINTAYLKFVDPEFSEAYRKSAYNLDRFLNASPRNLVAYQIAQQKDDEANNPQQSPAR